MGGVSAQAREYLRTTNDHCYYDYEVIEGDYYEFASCNDGYVGGIGHDDTDALV